MPKVLFRNKMKASYNDLEFQVIDWTAYDAPDMEESDSNSDEEERLLMQRNKTWKYNIKAYIIN